MARRIKKSIIYPEQARAWLARYESGEALKTIAHIDHYDIRTVKRQVEEADSERLNKEVRQSVLRAALERHFNDFTALAERLRNTVFSGSPILFDQDADCLIKGLRQHLPRAPLWEYLDQYQAKFDSPGKLKKWYEARRRNGHPSSEESGNNLNTGRANQKEDQDPVSAAPAQVQAEVGSPINMEDFIIHHPDFYLPQGGSHGPAFLEVKERMPQGAPIQEYNASMQHLQKQLQDELTTIILRRVVPGRCDYCPL